MQRQEPQTSARSTKASQGSSKVSGIRRVCSNLSAAKENTEGGFQDTEDPKCTSLRKEMVELWIS